MIDPTRSYERIDPDDLRRLGQIARRDRELFFSRHAKYGQLVRGTVMPVFAEERCNQGQTGCFLGEDPDGIE